MKPCRTDIKILFVLQEDLHTYAGNLKNGIRLQINTGDKQAKKKFKCTTTLF